MLGDVTSNAAIQMGTDHGIYTFFFFYYYIIFFTNKNPLKSTADELKCSHNTLYICIFMYGFIVDRGCHNNIAAKCDLDKSRKSTCVQRIYA